jgi:hypothetical protein
MRSLPSRTCPAKLEERSGKAWIQPYVYALASFHRRYQYLSLTILKKIGLPAVALPTVQPALIHGFRLGKLRRTTCSQFSYNINHLKGWLAILLR